MKAMRKLVFIGVPLLMAAVATINPGFAQSADTDRENESVASARSDYAGGTDATHDPMVFAQKRLNHLKSKLAITGAQEPQWSAFSDTVMQQMEQMKAAHHGGKPKAQTAPERIDRRVAWMKERTAAMEAMGQAAKELYAMLSPEQRQIADQRLMRWHARRGS